MSVELLWEGSLWANWLEYSVASDLDRPAAAFAFRARPRGDISTPATPGGSIEARVDGETVLWGLVESVTTRRTADSVELEVAGRDAGGLLLTASSDPTWRWRRQSLSSIASTVCTYAGVPAEPVLDFDPTVSQGKAEPGESCWATLQRLAESEGMRLWIEPSGALHVGQWVSYAEPRGELRRRRAAARRENNIITSSVTRAFETSWSEVTVWAERGSGGGHAHWTGSWVDTTAPFYRPLVVVAGEVRNQAGADAAASVAGVQAQRDRFRASYEVRGHLDASGLAWAPNTIVQVTDEDEAIDRRLVVVGRTLSLSKEKGTRTELRLAVPEGEVIGG